MDKIRLGAVMSSPTVPEIWWEFGKYLKDHGLELEMVYHDFYKPQIASFIRGEIDITWNGPLGFIATDHFSKGKQLNGPMRDTDISTKSLILVREDSDIQSVADLKGKVIGFGATDSAEGRIAPISYLRNEGLELGRDYQEKNYSADPDQLFGTFSQGEKKALQALKNKEVDASACWIGMYNNWVNNPEIDTDGVRILTETSSYSHCIFCGHPDLDVDLYNKFVDLMLNMDKSDPRVIKGMEMEHLNEWVEGQTDNFKLLKDGCEYLHIFDSDFKGINF